MSQKRKDNKGRILKTGESQRKDFTYQYRYEEPTTGKRKCVYAPTLDELREKEQEVEEAKLKGVAFSSGSETMLQLIERYIKQASRGWRQRTLVAYTTMRNIIERSPIGARPIRDIRYSDAKAWFMSLYEDGLSKGTISIMRALTKTAFQMAVEDDILTKNPFAFSMSFIPNDKKESRALTVEEQKEFLGFMAQHAELSSYYDQFAILLGTGLRVSELSGLTRRDVDFNLCRISVDHQLLRDANGGFTISTPKSRSGTRFIRMTNGVKECFERVIANRPHLKSEVIVDGYAGFLFVNRAGLPKTASVIEAELSKILREYAKTHSHPLPHFTPHSLRHTFCTNMAEAGIDPKHLQYLMGHASMSITYNVYRHVDYQHVERGIIEASERLEAMLV